MIEWIVLNREISSIIGLIIVMGIGIVVRKTKTKKDDMIWSRIKQIAWKYWTKKHP